MLDWHLCQICYRLEIKILLYRIRSQMCCMIYIFTVAKIKNFATNTFLKV